MTLTSCPGLLSSWSHKTSVPLRTHRGGRSCRPAGRCWRLCPGACSPCQVRAGLGVCSGARRRGSSLSLRERLWEGEGARCHVLFPFPYGRDPDWTLPPRLGPESLEPHTQKPNHLTTEWPGPVQFSRQNLRRGGRQT
uniref:Uncharacterized protein n=1 Tax=Pipistrellus kuhlii TaxID=59472 RepID=A0A7J7RNL8_PIPKU|nr:hypothetical protein mPipKuh1_010388 [Pipistrellus kuhlii]